MARTDPDAKGPGRLDDAWRRSNDWALGEKLLTKGEVAQLCRVEVRTVDRWVAAGKIKSYRIPSGRLLFRKRDVLMAAERRQERIAQIER
jgi:excisionase family DNA binding protein